MRHAPLAICLTAISLAATAFAFDGPRLTYRDAGLYVGTAHGYMLGPTPFAFTIEQVSRGSSPDEVRDRVEKLNANHKRVVIDFFLYEKSDEQAKPATEYMAMLDGFLAKITIAHVYAITLAEENIFWNGHGEMLAELYKLVKAKYPELAVYQWYSPGAGAPGFDWPWLPADGWLIDEYCMPGPQFEKLVRKYTILDKPLIHIAWAAPGWKEFATWDKVWDSQLAICRRYNVPISFFCWWPKDGTPPPPDNKDLWSWAAPKGTEHYRVWHEKILPYVSRLKEWPKPGETSMNDLHGSTIPIAGNEQGVFTYHEDFHTNPRFLDDPTIAGCRNLRYTGQRLEVKPDQVATLTYSFESPFTLHGVTATVKGSGPDTSVTLALSSDGKKWTSASNVDATLQVSLPQPPVPLRRFLVRIQLSGERKWPATLEDLVISAQVDEPAVPQVLVSPDAKGRVSFTDDFRSQLYLHAGKVTNPGGVNWQPGSLRMSGVQGRANETTIDYLVTSPKSYSRIIVGLNCQADARNFAASVELSTSLDGITFTAPVSTATSGKDPFRGMLRAEVAGPTRDLWVRIKMVNACGVANAGNSPVMTGLHLSATLGQ